MGKIKNSSLAIDYASPVAASASLLGPNVPGVTAPLRPTRSQRESVRTGLSRQIDPTGLYDYQREGASWLRAQTRALLGDEMGVGKTIQALRAIPEEMGALVVCPASLKLMWADQARVWRPDLRVFVGDPGEFLVPEPGNLCVVSYQSLPDQIPGERRMLVRDPLLFAACLILDEVHMVKNYRASRTARVALLARQCAVTWGLTGTPLSGKPRDLWGVCQILGLGNLAFKDWDNFVKLFHGRANKWGGLEFNVTGDLSDTQDLIREGLAKVMLRRTRAQVLPELPAKQVTQIPLEPPAFLLGTLTRIEQDWQKAGTKKLPPFSQLSSVRAELAEARIPDVLEWAERFEHDSIPLLVFSAHIKPVQAFAGREGWGVITGSTREDVRKTLVDLFQGGLLHGLAMTIDAGGVGLTLTRAADVLFADLSWDPSENQQAEARVLRIGQNSDQVRIYQMVADHPVDRRVLALLTGKEYVLDVVLGEPGDWEDLPGQPEQILKNWPKD